MFRSVSVADLKSFDCEVMAVFEGQTLDASPEVQSAIARPEFQGKVGQVVEAFPSGSPRLMVVGLGAPEKLTVNVLRKAFASLARKLSATKMEKINIQPANLPDAELAGRCLGEACAMLSWTSGSMKSEASEVVDLTLGSENKDLAKGLKFGVELAHCSNLARTYVNTPPNIATPLWMADRAKELEAHGLKVTVLQGEELVKENLIGIISVGKASENPPCFIRVEYRPKNATGKPIVILGKTITYDTGGLNIKQGLIGLKGDKAGGCAVLGIMKAVATLIKPNVPVVGLLVAAENSVSNNAYRPDDVITYPNGITVEVTNTDAEGRLVLADGLIWACEKEDPCHLVDMATLTGGVGTALGDVFAGLFATDETLATELQQAGESTGERLWRLPLDDEYRELMKSPIADLVNSRRVPSASPVQGAVFLWEFVREGLSWAHLDIAATAGTSKDAGMYPPGATGFGVRLICDWLAKN